MKNLTRKKILVYSVLVLLVIFASYIMLQIENHSIQSKEETQLQLKMDAVSEVIQTIDDMWIETKKATEERVHQNVAFMTETLAEDVTEEGYTGPTLFEDGAVVEIRNGKVIWPDGVPNHYPELDPEDVRREEHITVKIPSAEEENGVKAVVFLPGHIAGNYYYIDWLETDEIKLDQSAYLREEAFLERTEEAFGGSLLLVSDINDTLTLLNKPTLYSDVESVRELGFTSDIIRNRQKTVQIREDLCLCAYAEVLDGAATLIYASPIKTLRSRSMMHVGIAITSVLIILVTLSVYALSVQEYVQKNKLPKQLELRYRTKSFRRIIILAGLSGAIIVFVLTAVSQTMDALHEESIVGAKSMNSLFEYLQSTLLKRSEYDKVDDSEWRVYQGEQIIAHLGRHPEDATREKLQRYCDIYNIDYIMLFDSTGNETVSSSEYTGFTMDAGLGENSEDFRRLLLGVHSIVHDVSTDPVTGLTRKMAGVSIPAETPSGKNTHGALIMATVPKEDPYSVEASKQLKFLNSGNHVCFFTDKEDGTIIFSGDSSLLEKKVTEIGLPEKSLEDGYTDFATVNGVYSYVTMVSQKNANFYYIITATSLFSNTLPAACIATIAYLIIFTVIAIIILQGYNKNNFEEWIRVNAVRDEKPGREPELLNSGKKKQNYSELLMTSGKNDYIWETSTPEKKAGLILKIDFLLLIVLPVVLMAIQRKESIGGSSLLNFILYGNWMRGLNLFSISAIIYVIVISFIILLVCNGVLSLIAGIAGKSGETICRLLYSLCRYTVILAAIYYIFEYLGISLATYFAGVGVISLAISMGSRDMVSDIMSGIMILFEHQFQVGDYVELDNSRGKVLEMGIRSTKLLTPNNDIKYISNSYIRTVTNKSKNASPCITEIDIVSDDTIEAIEEKFRKALKEIGTKNKKIVGDLQLVGITRVTGGGSLRSEKTVSMRIRCECKERDYDDVRDFINRELYLFCERENIEIR